MNLLKITLSSLIILFSISAPARTLETLNNSQQLLLVTTPDWETTAGTLQRFHRKSTQSKWLATGDPIPIVVGKHGMAWGVGFTQKKGPIKKEGDGKSPAGIFKIGPAFGFTEKSENQQFDYLALSASTFCVDDSSSRYYNQIIDTKKVKPTDWKSREQMRAVSLYKHGAVIQYNSKSPKIGKGSCIFMHIWRRSDSGTAGCVAMEENNLKEILAWLKADKHPVVALAPQGEQIM